MTLDPLQANALATREFLDTHEPADRHGLDPTAPDVSVIESPVEHVEFDDEGRVARMVLRPDR